MGVCHSEGRGVHAELEMNFGGVRTVSKARKRIVTYSSTDKSSGSKGVFHFYFLN